MGGASYRVHTAMDTADADPFFQLQSRAESPAFNMTNEFTEGTQIA